MIVIGLVLGFLAAPATSSAIGLFHGQDPNCTVVAPLPLRVPQNNPPNLNLCIDPDDPSDDTIYAFDMDVKPSGSLTYSFQRDAADFSGEDPNGVLGISGTEQDGWPTRFRVGVFAINSDGAVGDELILLSGHYTPESFIEQLFLPETLAVVAGCGDRIRDFGEDCDPPGFDDCSGGEPCNPETCLCRAVIPPDKAQQKCMNSINKGAAKVAKAQAGDNASCIKNGGKGKLGGQTVDECITSDPKGKVAKAANKIKTADCVGGAAPGGIPGLLTTSGAIKPVMVDKDVDLIHAIFGTNLDAVIVVADKGIVGSKEAAKCQAAVAKAVGKCQDAMLSSFNSCKKNGLKSETITDAGTLETECMTPDIPDGKGKIAKKCGGDFDLAKKCSGLDTDALFPGCEGEVHADCIRDKIECEVCKSLNALDGLERNCDQFDNGIIDGTCE
jgi:hypothetical protein